MGHVRDLPAAKLSVDVKNDFTPKYAIIKNKEKDLKTSKVSLGTTPRRITDLVGSLSDLVSGSGDKGTPIVLITGYFDNYATE